MEISPGIFVIGTSLWIEKEKVLVINDLHLGYEGELHDKGVLVPKVQYDLIIKEMNKILSVVKPVKIVINGDLKHEFGRISNQEWKDVLAFLDYLPCEIVIVQGNHDPIVKPIAEKKNVTVVGSLEVGDTLIVHGDEVVETSLKRIVVGHEHPAITIVEKSKREKFKCFLKGSFKGKEIIVVPSFNPLLEGTDVLQGKVLSPFLENLEEFDVFIVSEGEAFAFGKVKSLQ